MEADTPAEALAIGDPGDDTARRFRYQYTWAAIVCCQLFDQAEDCVEVFCEHHEDILLRLGCGKFRGLQVKTRDAFQEPWKIGDDAVDGSLARFCGLEKKYPGQFESFRFLTNHQLYPGKNGKDVRHVLEEVQTTPNFASLSAGVARYVRKLAGGAECDVDTALSALKKTSADDSLPKLTDVTGRLVDTLEERWAPAGDLLHSSLKRAAIHLVAECFRASSLSHEDLLPAYLPATSRPREAELQARIDGKRIDVARVRQVLEDGLASTATLQADPSKLVEPGFGDRSLLQKKLEAGGMSVVSQNSATDLRDKADYLGLVWTKKLGREQGLQRHAHVRSLVLSDAASAFQAAHIAGDPFGFPMLEHLRERFRRRRTANEQLFDCSIEHLEGFAYGLTAECQIQWSVAQPWKDES